MCFGSNALLPDGGGHLLHSELVSAHWDAVHKLHGAPQAVKLHTFVHVHHAITGQRPAPDGVIEEPTDTGEDDLEHGQTAAQTLFGQEVTLTSDGNLLKEQEKVLRSSQAEAGEERG